MWISENSSGNGEVHAVVLYNERGSVLPGASPDGDVTFHVIGTVLQQASEGNRVFTVGAVAECVGCCSQRVGNVHASTSFSASRRLFARWRHAGVQVLTIGCSREAVPKYNLTAMTSVSIRVIGSRLSL